MNGRSTPELLTLHAVRLLGFANTEAVSARSGTSSDQAERILSRAEDRGWVQYLGFAGLSGWSLTDEGKAENERQLAIERAHADVDNSLATIYQQFLPLNARLVRAVTDWQIRPVADAPLRANDHSDDEWDGRVLGELAAIGAELRSVSKKLTTILSRFDGYALRYAAALRRAVDGEYDWVDKTSVDSCHRVWFQLHEDLIATLGIER